MKIMFELEADEQGTPIEVANAIIKCVMGKEYYPFEFNRNALSEIAGHIEVYLKHCEVKGGAHEECATL